MQVMQRMGQVTGQMGEAIGPDRGNPLPGTAHDALAAQDTGGLAAGISALKQRDVAFEPEAFVQFANQVFAAVCRSFAAGDASMARAVLADSLWDPMAALAGGPMAQAGQAYGMLTASGALVGLHSDALYDTAIVRFTVQVPPEMSGKRPPWPEEWTFQRSLVPGGDPMALDEKCPGCGSAAKPDASGNCPFCHQAIPAHTSGWLVTTVHNRDPMIEQGRQEMIARIKQNPAGLEMAPDYILRQIPPETLAELAPDVVARLKAQGRLP